MGGGRDGSGTGTGRSRKRNARVVFGLYQRRM